jgi:NAD(P)-dependent dehydrogenase (short-subunit alcohol dehydrogenase family)
MTKVKETIPHLRATKGSMVFVSSGAATNAYTSWGAYGSSKAALNSLARHVAVEEPNISAVAISPGRVDTDMQKELRDKGGAAMAEKDHASFVSAFERGTLNKPDRPAAVIANLAVGMDPTLSGRYFRYVCSRRLVACSAS